MKKEKKQENFKSLGFEEGELCYSDSQYPVQKFVLKGMKDSEKI